MKVLLFGATGAAGGAVLTACLKASVVDEVRAITRKPLATTHAKLRNILHSDFLDYSAIAHTFEGVDACLFCLGVSITKVSKNEYQRITHDFTLAAARTLLARSPSAAFHYISGKGTRPDSRMFWSQVKARTERMRAKTIGCVLLEGVGEIAIEYLWSDTLIDQITNRVWVEGLRVIVKSVRELIIELLSDRAIQCENSIIVLLFHT